MGVRVWDRGEVLRPVYKYDTSTPTDKQINILSARPFAKGTGVLKRLECGYNQVKNPELNTYIGEA